MSELNPSDEPDDPKLRQILDAASDLATEQRPAFLDRACAGVAGLRERVEHLLRDLERAGDFLANPTAGHPAAAAETVCAPTPHEPIGTRVFGPDTIMGRIELGQSRHAGRSYADQQPLPLDVDDVERAVGGQVGALQHLDCAGAAAQGVRTRPAVQ